MSQSRQEERTACNRIYSLTQKQKPLFNQGFCIPNWLRG